MISPLQQRVLSYHPWIHFFEHELLPLVKRRLSLLENRASNMMRIPSLSQELFDNATSSPLLIMQATTTFVTNAHFRISDFKAQTHPLGNSVSLYSFCPMDMSTPAYAQAVAENKCLHIEFFTSNRASNTAPILGRVNQVKTVQCLQSALAHMSAVIQSLLALPEGYYRVLCTVLEHLGKVLNYRSIQEAARSVPSMTHVRAHHIFNILQGIIASFIELALSSEVKCIASQGSISISFYQPAIVKLQGFYNAVMALFQVDLSNRIHPITYTAELADCCPAQAPRHPATSSVQQVPKKAKLTTTFTIADYEKAKATGFLRKTSNTISPHTWGALIRAWDVSTVCCYYSVQGFFCNHGASGTLHGK